MSEPQHEHESAIDRATRLSKEARHHQQKLELAKQTPLSSTNVFPPPKSSETFERRDRPERAKNDDSSALDRYRDNLALKQALDGGATATMNPSHGAKPHKPVYKPDFNLADDTIIDLSAVHNILFNAAESQGLNSQDVITDGVENWLKKVQNNPQMWFELV
jgi:hypothetical protein